MKNACDEKRIRADQRPGAQSSHLHENAFERTGAVDEHGLEHDDALEILSWSDADRCQRACRRDVARGISELDRRSSRRTANAVSDQAALSYDCVFLTLKADLGHC